MVPRRTGAATSGGGTIETRLIADIGGTNARFALAGEERLPLEARTLPGANYPNIIAAAKDYLGDTAPRIGIFAVNGPIEGDIVRPTNTPWNPPYFSIKEVEQALGLERLLVVNDFVAQARAVEALADDERKQLGGGEEVAQRPIAVLGAGTGLGVGGLIPNRGIWLPVPSEGGHCSFAPHDPLQIQILERLTRHFNGHVSNERLVAGPGMVNLARAIAEIAGAELGDLTPKDVSDRARERSCPHCAKAIEIYPSVLGAAAGDLALMFLARGGVYIGGGVVPRLGDLFDVERFRAAFVDKGRFRPLLEQIPTYLVVHPDPGLLGAARLSLEAFEV